MVFLCVFLRVVITFPDGEGAASGQWGLVSLKGQASSHSIFTRRFKNSINSHLFDPPLLNNSAEKPFAYYFPLEFDH